MKKGKKKKKIARPEMSDEFDLKVFEDGEKKIDFLLDEYEHRLHTHDQEEHGSLRAWRLKPASHSSMT